jgi:hypothetical protein
MEMRVIKCSRISVVMEQNFILCSMTTGLLQLADFHFAYVGAVKLTELEYTNIWTVRCSFARIGLCVVETAVLTRSALVGSEEDGGPRDVDRFSLLETSV